MSSIWDDSALINAFNSSVSKYQEMHGLAHNSKGAVKHSHKGEFTEESKAETETSIIAEEPCTADGEMKRDTVPEVIKSMPLYSEASVSRGLHLESSYQPTSANEPLIYSNRTPQACFSYHSTGDKKLQDHESKQELLSQIEFLEQRHQQLQEQVSQLYNIMNARDGNYGYSNGFAQAPTQSDGFSYQSPYGSHHYHWGFYPHPQCLWHNHPPMTTPATCTQPPQPPSQDPVHVFAEAPRNHSPDHAQLSENPLGSSPQVVAEVVRDTICRSLSSLPGISAQTSTGANSSESPSGDNAFKELLNVWFNAGFQTARYLLENGTKPN
ncbi:hypothetical protein O6H91_11G101700 [Diphasiastrum complanatum]|uniref:Uncharacterized protein n=1 Tax=Diphasiastrum complanatum TaxID=34168 RepID=A0ACC2CCF0_DIPCM|nr:hypothetical protein O6H91_11G101700 [Diphasiastrum complanatum]